MEDKVRRIIDLLADPPSPLGDVESAPEWEGVAEYQEKEAKGFVPV